MPEAKNPEVKPSGGVVGVKEWVVTVRLKEKELPVLIEPE